METSVTRPSTSSNPALRIDMKALRESAAAREVAERILQIASSGTTGQLVESLHEIDAERGEMMLREIVFFHLFLVEKEIQGDPNISPNFFSALLATVVDRLLSRGMSRAAQRLLYSDDVRRKYALRASTYRHQSALDATGEPSQRHSLLHALFRILCTIDPRMAARAIHEVDLDAIRSDDRCAGAFRG